MSADRTVIEVLRGRSKVGAVLATAMILAFAALAFYGVFSGQAHGVSLVIAIVIGLMFGTIAVYFVINMPAVLGRHTLTFDRVGLRYRVTRGAVTPFSVRWDELSRAAVSTAEHDARTNTTTLVRLDLTPVDPASFAAAHPELAGLASGTGYRLPLGPNRFLIEKLHRALTQYAGARYAGVVDDGRASGLTYL